MGWAWWFTPIIPKLLEVKMGRSLDARSSKTNLANTVKPHLYQKNKTQKLARCGGNTPVVPATKEAEAGEFA